MKKIITGILMSLAFTSFTYADDDISITGFSIVKNNQKAMTLRFRDEDEFVISKQRFKNEIDARTFCNQQKSSLDSEFNALLLAMSGAANLNEFIENSITFKLNAKTSGVWSWSGKNNNAITLIFDGKGTSTHEVKASQLNASLGSEVKLPAICYKKLAPLR